MPPGAGDRRVVPDLAYLAMRHVLDGIVGRPGLGDLDHAGVARATEVGAATGVAGVDAIDVDHVVVQPGHDRRGRHGPVAVGLFLHVDLRAAPEVELHLGGVGRLDAHLHAAFRIDPRILGTQYVRFGWFESVRALRVAQ